MQQKNNTSDTIRQITTTKIDKWDEYHTLYHTIASYIHKKFEYQSITSNKVILVYPCKYLHHYAYHQPHKIASLLRTSPITIGSHLKGIVDLWYAAQTTFLHITKSAEFHKSTANRAQLLPSQSSIVCMAMHHIRWSHKKIYTPRHRHIRK